MRSASRRPSANRQLCLDNSGTLAMVAVLTIFRLPWGAAPGRNIKATGQRPRLGAPTQPLGVLVEMSYDNEAFDLTIFKCLQECVVIFKGYTSIEITVRPEHVTVGEEAHPSKEITVANRFQA